MEWVGPLIMAIGSVTVAAIGIVVGKGTASAQKNVATIERTGPDWDAFMERVEKHNAETRAQLNGRIDRLQNKVQRLEDKLAEKDKLIEQKDALIEKKDQLLHLAMSELARFVRKFPDDVVTRSIAYELKDEMSAYWPRDEPN
ncbi:hypothetical protein [Pasteurella phage PMP-GADVASU-IND]|nr:hypothetical protein [Pasteurella phage PMP-GADVASU-IND]